MRNFAERLTKVRWNTYKYRANSYTWPCVSGILRVFCPVYSHVYNSVHWTSHYLQGTRKTLPCLSSQVVLKIVTITFTNT